MKRQCRGYTWRHDVITRTSWTGLGQQAIPVVLGERRRISGAEWWDASYVGLPLVERALDRAITYHRGNAYVMATEPQKHRYRLWLPMGAEGRTSIRH